MAETNQPDIGDLDAELGAGLDDESLFAELDSEVLLGDESEASDASDDLDFDLDLGDEAAASDVGDLELDDATGDLEPASGAGDEIELEGLGEAGGVDDELGDLSGGVGDELDDLVGGSGDELDLDLESGGGEDELGDLSGGAGDELDLDLESGGGDELDLDLESGVGDELDLDLESGGGGDELDLDLEAGGEEPAGAEAAAPQGAGDDLDLDVGGLSDDELDLEIGSAADDLDLDLEAGADEELEIDLGGDEAEESLEIDLDSEAPEPEVELEAGAGVEETLGDEMLEVPLEDEPGFEADLDAAAQAEPELPPEMEALDVDLEDSRLDEVDLTSAEDESGFDLGGGEEGERGPSDMAEDERLEMPDEVTAEAFEAAEDVELDEDALVLELNETEPLEAPEGEGAAEPTELDLGPGEMTEVEEPAAATAPPDEMAFESGLEEQEAVDLDAVGIGTAAPPEEEEGRDFVAVQDVELDEDALMELNLDDVDAAEHTSYAPGAISLQEEAPAPGRAEVAPALSDEILLSVSHQISVELGSVTLNGRELMDLAYGSVIPLERMLGEPVDLVLDDKSIAQAEVVLINGKNLGVRIVALQK